MNSILKSTLKNILWLAVALALCSLATMSFGSRWELSCQAALLVWLSGSLGLFVVGLRVQPANRLSCILAAMLVRMSLPGVAIALLSLRASDASARSLAGLIVVHYLAALAVEVPLMIRLIQLREPMFARTQRTRP